MELRDELDAKLGQFPLFKFWGPMADITSSDWIARATLHMMETRNPDADADLSAASRL